jgi:hypothetical protein
MKRARWLALACFTSCLTAVPPAQAIPVKCDKSKEDVDLAVVYANGMRTTHQVAVASLQKLRPMVDAQLGKDPYTIAYGLAYNTRKGRFASLGKVVKERLGMSLASLVRVLSGALPMPEGLSEELKRIATEVEQVGFGDDPSLERHVQIYRDHLFSGRKVVVIAHSEGNMYANAAYRRLFESALPTPGERSFGIVGIATPTQDIAGWHPAICSPVGCYTTLAEDLVIKAVRSTLPSTAPPNMSGAVLTAGTRDLGWHGLEGSYLRHDASRKQILEHVAAFVAEFEPLEKKTNDTGITASLAWNTEADLDLHVYERDGRGHVYPDFATDTGFLDLDDRDGFGPEHYFAHCPDLEDGDFRFAVGYFSGEGPVTARLQLKVGEAVRTYQRVLDEPIGEHSLRNPTNLVVLRVLDRRESPVDANDQLIDDYEIEFEPSAGVQ